MAFRKHAVFIGPEPTARYKTEFVAAGFTLWH